MEESKESMPSEHSRVVPIYQVFVSFLISVALGILLAFVYSFLVYYSPFILLNLFLAFMFGLFVGSSTGFILDTRKVRNPVVYFVVVPVVVLVALYCSWAILMWLEVDEIWRFEGEKREPIGLLGLILDPAIVWWHMIQTDKVIAIALRGKTLFDAPIWIGHVIEAVVVFVIGLSGLSFIGGISEQKPKKEGNLPQ